MPHQNVDAGKATAQNAVTDPVEASDRPDDDRDDAAIEPNTYAAADVGDATLAPPAAGEVADAMDEGEAMEGELQSGADHTNIAAHSRDDAHHGPKATQHIQEQLKR